MGSSFATPGAKSFAINARRNRSRRTGASALANTTGNAARISRAASRITPSAARLRLLREAVATGLPSAFTPTESMTSRSFPPTGQLTSERKFNVSATNGMRRVRTPSSPSRVRRSLSRLRKLPSSASRAPDRVSPDNRTLERDGKIVLSMTPDSSARSSATRRAMTTSSTLCSKPRMAPPCLDARPSKAAIARANKSRSAGLVRRLFTAATDTTPGSLTGTGFTASDASARDGAETARRR